MLAELTLAWYLTQKDQKTICVSVILKLKRAPAGGRTGHGYR